jgi:hypothetical protein
MVDPVGMYLADRAVREHVRSGRADAPVVPERPPRRHTVRRAAVSGLRRLADRLEPALRVQGDF